MLLLVLIGLGFIVMILMIALIINPPEALVKRAYRINSPKRTSTPANDDHKPVG